MTNRQDHLGNKKLKCSREQPVCSRCQRERLVCVHSSPKQMGRPKKRQRSLDEDATDDTAANTSDLSEVGSNVLHRLASSGTTGHDLTNDSGGLDVNALDLGLASGGNPWPWRSISSTDTAAVPGALSIPGLTTDNSPNEPPAPDFDLQHQPIVGGADSDTSHAPSSSSLTSTGDCLTPSLPKCACLSTMYLTLNTLSSMDSSSAFPFALHPLRQAMQSTSEILACEECPRRLITTMQNTSLLGALLTSIAERFSRILVAIEREAERAEDAHELKSLRLADLNSSHLHGPGCLAVFSMELSPAEWRKLCKKVVKVEVHGPSDGSICCPCFMDLARRMELRQQKWHSHPPAKDLPKDQDPGSLLWSARIVSDVDLKSIGGRYLCVSMIRALMKMVESFDWS